MNKDKAQDKKILDFLMDDDLWPRKKYSGKKIIEKKQEIEEKAEISLPDEITINSDEKGFGEVNYAILKSVTYGFKDIKQISKALQIRTIVIEKHIYKLIKEGFIKYFQYCVITSKGKKAIEDFEKNSPEDVWKPIDDFIVSVVERTKEKKLKLQKMTDIALLISTVVLVLLIIYFGIFA